MKVVKKPVEVDAWKVTDLINLYITRGHEALPEPVCSAYEDGILDFPSGMLGLSNAKPERIDVVTLEGIMQAPPGWWLVQGTRGEFYPVRSDAFWDTFVEVDHEPRLIS